MDELIATHATRNVMMEYALENGFVKTDAAMRTNIPGLFAAGDMTGKPLQVANAVGDGLVAALAAVDYLDGVSPMTD